MARYSWAALKLYRHESSDFWWEKFWFPQVLMWNIIFGRRSSGLRGWFRPGGVLRRPTSFTRSPGGFATPGVASEARAWRWDTQIARNRLTLTWSSSVALIINGKFHNGQAKRWRLSWSLNQGLAVGDLFHFEPFDLAKLQGLAVEKSDGCDPNGSQDWLRERELLPGWVEQCDVFFWFLLLTEYLLLSWSFFWCWILPDLLGTLSIVGMRLMSWHSWGTPTAQEVALPLSSKLVLENIDWCPLRVAFWVGQAYIIARTCAFSRSIFSSIHRKPHFRHWKQDCAHHLSIFVLRVMICSHIVSSSLHYRVSGMHYEIVGRLMRLGEFLWEVGVKYVVRLFDYVWLIYVVYRTWSNYNESPPNPAQFVQLGSSRMQDCPLAWLNQRTKDKLLPRAPQTSQEPSRAQKMR